MSESCRLQKRLCRRQDVDIVLSCTKGEWLRAAHAALAVFGNELD